MKKETYCTSSPNLGTSAVNTVTSSGEIYTCGACEYKYITGYPQSGEPFIELVPMLAKNTNIPVQVYACPKCGAVQIVTHK